MTGFGVVSHWTLLVRDLERSDRFYRGALGWRRVAADCPGVNDRSARYARDGQRMELVTAPQLDRPAVPPAVNHVGLSHITVATDAPGSVMQALEDRGVVVRRRTLGSFLPDSGAVSPSQFLFEDPDGNLIETFVANGEDWNPFGTVGDSDAEPAATGVRHLSHWSLCVSDPARSLPFYRDVLGWQELAVMAWEGEGPSRVMDVGPARLTTWLLASGDQRVEIIHFVDPPTEPRAGAGTTTPGLARITVHAPDLDVAADRLAGAGVPTTLGEASSGSALLVHDPDGVEICCVTQPLDWRTA